MNRVDVTFDSQGVRCAAWLYRPDGEGSHPCVILGHGFGGIREMRLGDYASRFAQAGLAALVFDYRYFGASEGEPRQLLDIKSQLADWTAAISYARALDGIDAERIALWGTSFSGGHVIETAARDGQIAAVVAQVPFVNGLSSSVAKDIRSSLKCAVAGIRDELRQLRKRPPYYIDIAGPPGSLAALTSPDAEAGIRAIAPPDHWEDKVAARIVLSIGFYRPGKAASRVLCPLLICTCDQDVLTPPHPAIKAAREAPHSEVRRYPGGHFAIYTGELFDKAVADQCAFVTQHLLGPGK